MGKFSGASAVQQAQQGQLGGIELPVGTQPQAGQIGPSKSNLLQNVRTELEQAPEVNQQEVAADIADATLATAQEQERFRVPNMNENARAMQQGQPVQGERWQPTTPPQAPQVKPSANPQDTPDGDLMGRAATLAENMTNGSLPLNLYLDNDSFLDQPAAAENIRQAASGRAAEAGRSKPLASINAALASVNAIELNAAGKQVPSKSFMKIGSVVTENTISELAFGDPNEEAEAIVAELEGRDPNVAALSAQARRAGRAQGKPGVVMPEKFAREAGNAKLGQEVYKQFQRVQDPNAVPKKLPAREAELLGDVLKEAWYENNKDAGLMDKITVGDHNFYQLTPKGAQVISQGDKIRKKLLPKAEVLPSKQPLIDNKLPGDVGANEVKDVSGKLIDKSITKSVIQEAKANLATIGHVVDKQRGRLSLVTALPTLMMDSDIIADPNNPQAWMAEIHSVGAGKVRKYKAQDSKEGTEDTSAKMESLKSDLAQSIRAAATERKGANYLSYYTQSYNGRIAPQQTSFDPTSSKYIRALTRSPRPSVLGVPNKSGNPSTMKEWSLQQMYAMMLVPNEKGAPKVDALLPEGRIQKLKATEPQLLKWATEIEQALANSMSDAEYEAVSDAISQGMAIDDPNFPQFKPFELSPELAAKVASKGEDGIAFMDGLLDFKKYIEARQNGTPFSTYFNATFDGKTNGIASNGIQMGDERVAMKTGVLRTQDETLLDDDMDIRDDLQEEVLRRVHEGGFDHAGEMAADLNDIAEEVFKIRDLHKATTMTFGYGMDISGFQFTINDTAAEVEQSMLATINNPQSTPDERASASKFLTAYDNIKGPLGDKLGEALLGPYAEALMNVMSKDALEARTVMRSTAALFAAMNMPFAFKSPSGTTILIGGKMSQGAQGADASRYQLGKSSPKVIHYENTDTAAAPRYKTDKQSGERKETPGGIAFSGSVPGPVQALDAETVAQSFSGKSWQKMKAASGGQPYMHPIYDAFKVDLDGFATALEEVNNNWLDAGAKWSYLEAAQEGLRDAFMQFEQDFKGRSDTDKLSNQEAYYIKSMLSMTPSSKGNMWPATMNGMLKKALSPKSNESTEAFEQRIFKKTYDIINKMKLKDPENPTVGELKKFVRLMASELDIKSRLNSTIDSTNKKKAKLVRKARHEGIKLPNGRMIPGQYWAH